MRVFHKSFNVAGQAPALRFARPSPFHRRARACPSPCLDRENGPGRRAFFLRRSYDRGGQAPALRARKGFAFRSFRTLMSIARADAVSSRSFRTLMFSAAMHLLQIKDLKDLSVFLVGVTIDMQDLKDLKRFFHGCDREGQTSVLR